MVKGVLSELQVLRQLLNEVLFLIKKKSYS